MFPLNPWVPFTQLSLEIIPVANNIFILNAINKSVYMFHGSL